MEIRTKKKTLFFFPEFKNKVLNIYDNRGILFYSSDFVSNFGGKFYLPKGEFSSNHFIKQISGSLKQPKILLPKREHFYNHDFNKFKIIFGENKHKCSIFHDDKIILFDNSFLNKPKYIIDFILFHEMGHNYYETEYKADLYSVAKMLKDGYNISQIIKAPFSMSENQEERKIKILEHFNKM